MISKNNIKSIATMKKIILSMAMLTMVGATATAQENNDGLTPSRPLTSGELFQGMSRAIPTGRVVLPYGLDVTFDKTVHLIFPSAIRYVDLGSQNIIAGKAEDAENVLRVKASVKDFETETNMSVICEDGSFYAFNVKYADEPEKLSIEMKDFLSTTEGRLPSNRSDIYFKELGNESPVLVKLMMQTIYQNDRRCIKHIGAQQFGMKFLLRGLYAHNGLLYFHTRMENGTNMPYRSYNVKLKDALLQVGYLYPVLSDRGKNVFLYGGISALGGYEQLNEDKKLLPDGGDTARPLSLCLWRYRAWLGGSVPNGQGSLSCKGAGTFPIWNGRASFSSGCFCRTKV